MAGESRAIRRHNTPDAPRGNRRARRTARTAAYLALQLTLFLLALYVITMATPLHRFLFAQLDTAARTGFTAHELNAIAAAMTGALRGEGGTALARYFKANEIAHMQDVRALIRLAQWTIAAGALLFAAGMWASQGIARRENARAARNALIVTAALATLLAAAFAQDFYGAFIVFHRILFPGNELWLMDPATDLMVVVYDQRFFTAAAACIGALCLLSLTPLTSIWLRGRKATGCDTNRE